MRSSSDDETQTGSIAASVALESRDAIFPAGTSSARTESMLSYPNPGRSSIDPSTRRTFHAGRVCPSGNTTLLNADPRGQRLRDRMQLRRAGMMLGEIAEKNPAALAARETRGDRLGGVSRFDAGERGGPGRSTLACGGGDLGERARQRRRRDNELV